MELYLNYFSQDLYELIFAQPARRWKRNAAVVAEGAPYSGGLPFWIQGKQVKPAPVFWRASSKARTRQDFLSEKFPMMSASIPEQK
jgi:hypothetical protein